MVKRCTNRVDVASGVKRLLKDASGAVVVTIGDDLLRGRVESAPELLKRPVIQNGCVRRICGIGHYHVARSDAGSQQFDLKIGGEAYIRGTDITMNYRFRQCVKIIKRGKHLVDPLK